MGQGVAMHRRQGLRSQRKHWCAHLSLLLQAVLAVTCPMLTVLCCCCCAVAGVQELIYGTSEAPLAVSTLADSSKPLLFTMARLDRVKNLTGLVEW